VTARLLVVWGAFATSRHFDDLALWLSRTEGVEVLCYHHRGVARWAVGDAVGWWDCLVLR